jgi:DNA repair exonuclease SbcCD ATPase subunit
MRTLLFIFIAGLILGACDRKKEESSAPVPKVQPKTDSKKEWTPEEISKDPQGYLEWSDRKIEEQIAERNKRLKMVTEKKDQLSRRQEALNNNLDEVANVHKRLEQAYRRAEDEDRWPVKMGGRTFERDKARQILEETSRYLDDRKPLAADYDKAIAKVAETGNRLKKDVTDLNRLREQLALDLESIRLRQGMEELDQLQKTNEQLAAMSKMLSSNDSTIDLQALAEPAPVQTIDVDTLLK